MNIRKANSSDLNTILSLTPQAIYDGTLGEVMPSEEKARSMVKALLDRGGFYLLAVEHDEILGWVLAGTTKDPFTEKPLGFIYELYIRKPYRGQGHSKPLMNAAIEYFQQQGFIEVRLSAKAKNPAVRMYEDIGFTTKTVSMSLNLE
ncbi:GNAT family N-acetyltransferase [Planococcus maritimus]|uniref:GNAT family N-acetyltransferase n=1 Tax=Planococcus maritimus TaxID=192421 RepID=UPI00080F0821|nr:GNAT family N-acetyltransferase [Planococcus maritimus]ANU17124.1 GNAT family N-acetyltransferase [Planococcus maritimus]